MPNSQYFRANRINGELLYSVYNSQGTLAVYTRDRSWAEQLAEAFRKMPRATEVIVAELDEHRVKRR